MTTIRWSPQAADDLEAIRDFIARDSAHYAKLVMARRRHVGGWCRRELRFLEDLRGGAHEDGTTEPPIQLVGVRARLDALVGDGLSLRSRFRDVAAAAFFSAIL